MRTGLIILSLSLISCTNEATTISEVERDNIIDHHLDDTGAIEHQVEEHEIQMLNDTITVSPSEEKEEDDQRMIRNLSTQLADFDIVPFGLGLDIRSKVIDKWKLEDSIRIVILSASTGVSYDEFLLTIDSDNEIISTLKIRDEADRDLSSEYYEYTAYEILTHQEILLSRHEIEGPEDNEKVSTTEEYWIILKGGKLQQMTE